MIHKDHVKIAKVFAYVEEEGWICSAGVSVSERENLGRVGAGRARAG
jgi:hypothetical protein